MDRRNTKRKDKKKKKKKDKMAKLINSLENDFVDETQCTENNTSENIPEEKPKKKKKKHVAFDLPHDHLRVKRPKCSPLLSPSTGEEHTEVTEPSQSQVITNDSQSTSDDIHSQDLFITQKTFRLPMSEMSSGETSDRAEDSAKVLGIYFKETKEQSILFKTNKVSKSESDHGKKKSSSVNPFLDEPIIVSSSPDRDKTKERSIISLGLQQKSTKSVYTQTENFFTTEFTLHLNFCKRGQCQAQSEQNPGSKSTQ
ncbi:hypothetical protein WMY93_024000 [Mugilogobius chulae]|uniref:Uncharacterized protein n=1 Tax=Mugilogobius chulae TaxID=88201 RepID=A0AAW0NI38_9GOBI